MATHIPPLGIMRSNLVSLRNPITGISGACLFWVGGPDEARRLPKPIAFAVLVRLMGIMLQNEHCKPKEDNHRNSDQGPHGQLS